MFSIVSFVENCCRKGHTFHRVVNEIMYVLVPSDVLLLGVQTALVKSLYYVTNHAIRSFVKFWNTHA
jgi:hypothetical protein